MIMRDRYYDLSRFTQDISIKDVFAELGLENSTRKNIPCPSPDHADKRPSAHIYTDRNICRCFSCNRSFDTIDMVKMTLGADWREACDFLIERFGCEGFYEDRVYNPGEEQFPLTKDDLIALGLDARSKPIPLKVNYDEKADRMTVLESVRFSLRDFWKEDREGFNDLVEDKITEQTEHFGGLKASAGDMLKELEEKLLKKLDGRNLQDFLDLYHKHPEETVRGTEAYDILYMFFTGRRIQTEYDSYCHSLERLDKLSKEYIKDKGEEEYGRTV